MYPAPEVDQPNPADVVAVLGDAPADDVDVLGFMELQHGNIPAFLTNLHHYGLKSFTVEELLEATNGMTRRPTVPLGSTVFEGEYVEGESSKMALIKVIDDATSRELPLRTLCAPVRSHKNLLQLARACVSAVSYIVFKKPDGISLFEMHQQGITLSWTVFASIGLGIVRLFTILFLLESPHSYQAGYRLIPIWVSDGMLVVLDLAGISNRGGTYASTLELTRAYGLRLLELIDMVVRNGSEAQELALKTVLKLVHKCVDDEEFRRPSFDYIVEELQYLRVLSEG